MTAGVVFKLTDHMAWRPILSCILIASALAVALSSVGSAQDETTPLTVQTEGTPGAPSLILPVEPNSIVEAPAAADVPITETPSASEGINPTLTPAPAPVVTPKPRRSVRAEWPLWPVSGVITQYFTRARYRYGHTGLDIAARSGTPIYASVSGTVTGSGWNRFGYGMLVTIRGVDGRDYYYAHNSRLLVRRGQWVTQGQMISRMGSTGRSTGPHLHFEIRSGRRLLNPMGQLPSSRLALASYRGKKR
jgi:murein DD-endopeptidase MepM/ murein hydrolase activator NlpD